MPSPGQRLVFVVYSWTNTRRLTNFSTILDQCCRQWARIVPTFGERVVFVWFEAWHYFRLTSHIPRRLGYERVYLLLYKVADTPFDIQGDGLFHDWQNVFWSTPTSNTMPMCNLATRSLAVTDFSLIWNTASIWLMRALCTLNEFDIFVGDTCAWWVAGLMY